MNNTVSRENEEADSLLQNIVGFIQIRSILRHIYKKTEKCPISIYHYIHETMTPDNFIWTKYHQKTAQKKLEVETDCFECRAIGSLTLGSFSLYAAHLGMQIPKNMVYTRLFYGTMAIGAAGGALFRAIF